MQIQVLFGKSEASERVVISPMQWRNEKFGLKLNVMREDVPFLIGMEAMVKMGLKIDISDQSIVFRGKKGRMLRNKSGHLIWAGLECIEEADVEQESDMIYTLQHEDRLDEKVLKRCANHWVMLV